jgi:hypothetical protein
MFVVFGCLVKAPRVHSESASGQPARKDRFRAGKVTPLDETCKLKSANGSWRLGLPADQIQNQPSHACSGDVSS